MSTCTNDGEDDDDENNNFNENTQLRIQRGHKGFDKPPFTIQNVNFFLLKEWSLFISLELNQ